MPLSIDVPQEWLLWMTSTSSQFKYRINPDIHMTFKLYNPGHPATKPPTPEQSNPEQSDHEQSDHEQSDPEQPAPEQSTFEQSIPELPTSEQPIFEHPATKQSIALQSVKPKRGPGRPKTKTTTDQPKRPRGRPRNIILHTGSDVGYRKENVQPDNTFDGDNDSGYVKDVDGEDPSLWG